MKDVLLAFKCNFSLRDKSEGEREKKSRYGSFIFSYKPTEWSLAPLTHSRSIRDKALSSLLCPRKKYSMGTKLKVFDFQRKSHLMIIIWTEWPFLHSWVLWLVMQFVSRLGEQRVKRNEIWRWNRARSSLMVKTRNAGRLGCADIEREEGECAIMGKHDTLITQSIRAISFP